MNLKAFITALTLIPQFLVIVNQTVQAIETALQGFSGSQKLAAAEAQVNAFLAAAIQDAKVLSDVQGILTPVINATVQMFNAAGIFKHASVPPAPPARA